MNDFYSFNIESEYYVSLNSIINETALQRNEVVEQVLMIKERTPPLVKSNGNYIRHNGNDSFNQYFEALIQNNTNVGNNFNVGNNGKSTRIDPIK